MHVGRYRISLELHLLERFVMQSGLYEGMLERDLDGFEASEMQAQESESICYILSCKHKRMFKRDPNGTKRLFCQGPNGMRF